MWDAIDLCECCDTPIAWWKDLDDALPTADLSNVGIVSGRWLCGSCGEFERFTGQRATLERTRSFYSECES